MLIGNYPLDYLNDVLLVLLMPPSFYGFISDG
jgi:hypothetical protein